MRKKQLLSLILTSCLLVACSQNCPMTGSPNTTYTYGYFDSDGSGHFGSFTTNENGNATISDVPDNIDCSKIVWSVDRGGQIDPESPPVN